MKKTTILIFMFFILTPAFAFRELELMDSLNLIQGDYRQSISHNLPHTLDYHVWLVAFSYKIKVNHPVTGDAVPGMKISFDIVENFPAWTEPECMNLGIDAFNMYGWIDVRNGGNTNSCGIWEAFVGLGDRAGMNPDWSPSGGDEWYDMIQWGMPFGGDDRWINDPITSQRGVRFRAKKGFRQYINVAGIFQFSGRWSNCDGCWCKEGWDYFYGGGGIDHSRDADYAERKKIKFTSTSDSPVYPKSLPTTLPQGWHQWTENGYINASGYISNDDEDMNYAYPYVYVSDDNRPARIVVRDGNNAIMYVADINWKPTADGNYASDYLCFINYYKYSGDKYDSAGNLYRCVWITSDGDAQIERYSDYDYNRDALVNLMDFALLPAWDYGTLADFFLHYLNRIKPQTNLIDYAFMTKYETDLNDMKTFSQRYLK